MDDVYQLLSPQTEEYRSPKRLRDSEILALAPFSEKRLNATTNGLMEADEL